MIVKCTEWEALESREMQLRSASEVFPSVHLWKISHHWNWSLKLNYFGILFFRVPTSDRGEAGESFLVKVYFIPLKIWRKKTLEKRKFFSVRTKVKVYNFRKTIFSSAPKFFLNLSAWYFLWRKLLQREGINDMTEFPILSQNENDFPSLYKMIAEMENSCKLWLHVAPLPSMSICSKRFMCSDNVSHRLG